MLDALGDGRPRSRETPASRAKGGLLVVGGFVVLLFVIEIVNMLTLHSLNRTSGCGRAPRTGSWTSSRSRCCTPT